MCDVLTSIIVYVVHLLHQRTFITSRSNNKVTASTSRRPIFPSISVPYVVTLPLQFRDKKIRRPFFPFFSTHLSFLFFSAHRRKCERKNSHIRPFFCFFRCREQRPHNWMGGRSARCRLLTTGDKKGSDLQCCPLSFPPYRPLLFCLTFFTGKSLFAESMDLLRTVEITLIPAVDALYSSANAATRWHPRFLSNCPWAMRKSRPWSTFIVRRRWLESGVSTWIWVPNTDRG